MPNFNICPDCKRPFEVTKGPNVRCWPCRRTRIKLLQFIGTKVTQAIKAGILTRQPCEICGVERVDAHHDDYGKPLDVRWLCRSHHLLHHAELRRAFERRA